MNPQLTYLLALERARDLRHDAEKRHSVAIPSTTGARSWTSLPAQRTVGRSVLRRRLRAA